MLSFAHDLCLQLREDSDSNHRRHCTKRHHLVKEDELCTKNEWIKFRILYFYSPVHYKAEIHDDSYNAGVNSKSRSRIVEIYYPHFDNQNPWTPEIFQSIFDRMNNNSNERYFAAKTIVNLKEIIFVEGIRLWSTQRDSKVRIQLEQEMSFINDLRSYLNYSPEVIIKKLHHMIADDKKAQDRFLHVNLSTD